MAKPVEPSIVWPSGNTKPTSLSKTIEAKVNKKATDPIQETAKASHAQKNVNPIVPYDEIPIMSLSRM
jgi:hypothetical protein